MRVVRIDEGFVKSLITNKALWEAFPFLQIAESKIRNIPVPATKCSVCKQRAYKRAVNSVIDYVTAQIRGLTPEKRQEFKKALNADSLKIQVRTGGAPFEYTL